MRRPDRPNLGRRSMDPLTVGPKTADVCCFCFFFLIFLEISIGLFLLGQNSDVFDANILALVLNVWMGGRNHRRGIKTHS